MIQVILTAFAQLFGGLVKNALFLKAVLFTLFVVILPKVLDKFIYGLFSLGFSLVKSVFSSAGWDSIFNNPTILEVSGLAAWGLSRIGFLDILSVMLTAVVIRLSFKLIPFIRL